MRTRSKDYSNSNDASNRRNRNRRNRRRRRDLETDAPNIVVEETVDEMADNRSMMELLQAPTKGYGDAIVIPAIEAENFEIKSGMLSLIQAMKFRGREADNPHDHIRNFDRPLATRKFKSVDTDVVKLMLFPYSLDGAAKDWYEKEPPNSIITWKDLVSKFVNHFFPPSKMTFFKNEITRFEQKPNESFRDAWDRFKEFLRQFPHHSFSELHQIDTFYNGLSFQEQDSLNSAVGGNFLCKTPKDALMIIENRSKVYQLRNAPSVANVATVSSSNRDIERVDAKVDKLTNVFTSFLVEMQKKDAPAMVKAVEASCTFCGGPHNYYECAATVGQTSNVSALNNNFSNQNQNNAGPSQEGNYNQGKKNLNQNLNNFQGNNQQGNFQNQGYNQGRNLNWQNRDNNQNSNFSNNNQGNNFSNGHQNNFQRSNQNQGNFISNQNSSSNDFKIT